MFAVWLLAWNEGRSIHTFQGLSEGKSSVVTAPATIDPSLAGKLVYVSAPVSTATGLVDSTFGVSTPGLSLVRKVEMYQWNERVQSTTQENIGGSQSTQKTYYYEQIWSNKAINSAQFHVKDSTRVNPPNWIYGGASFTQPSANLGAYVVDSRVISKVSVQDGFVPPNLALPPIALNTTVSAEAMGGETLSIGTVDQSAGATTAT